MFFVFNCINVLLGCSSVALAENTNVGMAVFTADISHLCVVSGRVELLPSFLRARLSADAAISLSSPVLRFFLEHSPTLCDLLQCPPKTQYRCRQTSYRLRRHLYIAREAGGSPPKIKAYRRGCILENDHPPHGGHDPPILHYVYG